MLRAVSHAHASDAEPFGTIVLDSADRHLRRKLITTNQGDKVMVDLPEAVLLADGDVLVLEDGRTIEIIAAQEKLYEVRAGAGVPLRHLAWHLGNRHLAAQIDEDRILIRRDHVIADMLSGLGASVTEVIERFQPVHGAYHSHAHERGHAGDGHAQGHSAQDHAHRHDHHGHEHNHRHDEERPRGKRDRYGRLPGDPHYGHNHG
jgi:urease accessory protein